MTTEGKLRLGFLTAVDLEDRGYVGGLLVTNHFGRPLEFQCTTPVKANRTQEILYGPTLEAFVLADLIGKTLVDKVGVKPDLVLVERPQLLELRRHAAMPVACLSDHEVEGESFSLGRQYLHFEAAHLDDLEKLVPKAGLVPADADLQEPFERVREALRETMQAAAVSR